MDSAEPTFNPQDFCIPPTQTDPFAIGQKMIPGPIQNWYYSCTNAMVYLAKCGDGTIYPNDGSAGCNFPWNYPDEPYSELANPPEYTFACDVQKAGNFSFRLQEVSYISCNQYQSCVDGIFKTRTCASGLFFDPVRSRRLNNAKLTLSGQEVLRCKQTVLSRMFKLHRRMSRYDLPLTVKKLMLCE
jgi:hypothetical protein